MPVIYRIVMRILAVVQALFAGMTALTGGFADGGVWWERLSLILIHPVVAIVLAVLVFMPQPSRMLVIATTILLLTNIAVDALLSLAILSGITRGDWWLPLIFSLIPFIALWYCLALVRRS